MAGERMIYPEQDTFELDVRMERHHQDNKWGEQNHSDGTSVLFHKIAEDAKKRCKLAAAGGHCTWKHILEEEVLEAFAEEDQRLLRNELIQCAAVIKQWVECIDRRSSSPNSKETA